MHKCKYCGKEFKNGNQLGGHVSTCLLNPNFIEKRKKHGELKKFTVKCESCQTEFIVDEYENDFPVKKHYYCSKSCACRRIHSNETKLKISKGYKNSLRYKTILSKKLENYIQINDGEKIKYSKKKKYFTGSFELDNNYPEIGKHQSPKWFKKFIPFGFNYNTLYTKNIIDEYFKVKDLLYNEYIINHLSPHDIYQKYNCKEYIKHYETLLHLFKFYKFPIRNLSKSIINAFCQGKLKIQNCHSFGNAHWHKTWENKNVYLRSNLELNYAKYLDENKIKYEVENLRIKYFDTQRQYERCAIPDFYLPESNTIIEIKSNYTLDIQEMKDKFKAYKDFGYNAKLILNHNETDLNKL